MSIQELMATVVCHRHVVDKSMLNCNNTLFGGEVLRWMDKVGHEVAVAVTRQMMCTLSADNIKFLKPAFEGELVEVKGEPVDLGPVKMKVLLTATADPDGQNRRDILTGNFTFIQIDENLRPRRINYPLSCDNIV